MPVVPSFTGFAPAPNMAEAYRAGANTRIQKEQMAQQAAEASQRIAMGYAQIAAQHQQSQMELAAKKQMAQQEMLRQQQQEEMTNAYRQAMLGIERSNLERQQSETAMRLQESQQQQALQGETREAFEWSATAPKQEQPALNAAIAERSAILGGRNPPAYLQRNQAPSAPNIQEFDGRQMIERNGEWYEMREPRATAADKTDPLDAWSWKNELTRAQKEADVIREKIRDLSMYGAKGFKPEGRFEEGQVVVLEGYRTALKEKEAEIERLEATKPRAGKIQAPTVEEHNWYPADDPYSTNRAGRFEIIER